MKNKLRLRPLFLILLLLAAIIPLGGCLEPPSKGEPGGEAPTVITLWHSLQGEEERAFRSQLGAELKERTDVIVKLRYIPEQEFAKLAYQGEAGGEGPELFLASREVLYQLYKQGVLAPSAADSTNAFSAAAASFRFGDTFYAQPWLTDIPMLYFRQDLVQAPESLAALFEQNNVAMTAADTWTLSPLWLAQGGGLWSGNNVTLNKPENFAFLQQLTAWKTAGRLQVLSDPVSSFLSGQVNYMIGPGRWAEFLQSKDVPWAALPLSDLVPGGQVILANTLGIANSAIKTSESIMPLLKLIEETVLSPGFQGTVAATSRRIPSARGFYGSDSADLFPYVEQVLNNALVLEGNAPEWALIPFQDDAWSTVLNNGTDPQQVLNNAQTQGEEALGMKSYY